MSPRIIVKDHVRARPNVDDGVRMKPCRDPAVQLLVFLSAGPRDSREMLCRQPVRDGRGEWLSVFVAQRRLIVLRQLTLGLSPGKHRSRSERIGSKKDTVASKAAIPHHASRNNSGSSVTRSQKLHRGAHVNLDAVRQYVQLEARRRGIHTDLIEV